MNEKKKDKIGKKKKEENDSKIRKEDKRSERVSVDTLQSLDESSK